MVKYLLIFSHFHMVKVFKLFLVKLYYYDGALEESVDDCLDKFKSKIYRRRSKLRKYTNQRLNRSKVNGLSNIGIDRLGFGVNRVVLFKEDQVSYPKNSKFINSYYSKLINAKNERLRNAKNKKLINSRKRKFKYSRVMVGDCWINSSRYNKYNFNGKHIVRARGLLRSRRKRPDPSHRIKANFGHFYVFRRFSNFMSYANYMDLIKE